MNPFIKTIGLTYRYEDAELNESPVLNDLSLEISEGEFVAVLGHNGSGKSTFAKLLNMILFPTSGKIFINGRDLGRMRRYNVAKYRRTLGVVFQDFRLLQDRTVYENVAFAQRVIEVPKKEIARQVPRVLSVVGLSEKLRAYPAELSGDSLSVIACPM